MSDYVFKLTAQQWHTDPYYVRSSAPVHQLTVVAATKQEAINEGARVLGEAADHRYWRFWVKSMKDVRLLTDVEKELT